MASAKQSIIGCAPGETYSAFRSRLLDLVVVEQPDLQPDETTQETLDVEKVVKETVLYFRDAKKKSDKTYFVRLVQVKSPLFSPANSYKVMIAYGKRNGTLVGGTKTVSPVDRATAMKIFDNTVSEKQQKGYTTNRNGVPYSK